jgi:hypothetical protein
LITRNSQAATEIFRPPIGFLSGRQFMLGLRAPAAASAGAHPADNITRLEVLIARQQ